MRKAKKSKSRPSSGRPTAPKPTGRAPRPKARVEPPAISAPKVTLSDAMIEAWRKTVLSLARLPRGTVRSEHTEDELLELVLRQETKTVAEIWEIFTQDRDNLSKNLLGPARQVVGYLLGFHLANAARAQMAFQRADYSHGLRAILRSLNGTVVWNDLGAGTGAVAHAAMEFLTKAGRGPEALEARLYDNTSTLLDAAQMLLDNSGLAKVVRTTKVPLERLEPQRFVKAPETSVTGFSLGYVWNELKRNPIARQRVIATLTGPLTRNEPALVVVLEPAIQEISREAMALRDQLVAAGYVPLYPCPSAAACPMLERSRDWCYSEGLWLRPKSIQRLDRVLGMDRGHLSGALYMFASPALLAGQSPLVPRPVVVGRPKAELGFEYLLCRGDSLEKKAPAATGTPVARGLTLKD